MRNSIDCCISINSSSVFIDCLSAMRTATDEMIFKLYKETIMIGKFTIGNILYIITSIFVAIAAFGYVVTMPSSSTEDPEDKK